MTTERDSRWSAFDQRVGTWATEATHPAMPGVVVRGEAVVAWLEGKRFLSIRSRNEHPDFPDALSVIGDMEQDRVEEGSGASAAAAGATSLRMHYFDSRGVFRNYETRAEGSGWRWWREAPGFSQRFTGTLSADGQTIDGRSQLREDDVHWKDDLRITYRRRA